MSFAEEKDLVLIVGMHRSGTSAVGNLLNELGFYFGNNQLDKIEKINPDGFWEDKTIVLINESILERLGSSWYSFQPLPTKWWEKPEIETCYAAAKKWFDEEFHYQNPAAIKDPRLCRLLPFWLHFFSQNNVNIQIIFIYRNPCSVAASLNKRDGFGFEVSSLLYLIYMLEALEQAPGDAVTVICYENMLDEPAETAKLLLDEGLKHIQFPKRLRFGRIAKSVINTSKNHHPALVDTAGAAAYGKLALELYKDIRSSMPGKQQETVRKYRKSLDALLVRDENFLGVLQEEINYHVAINKKLSTLGAEHEYALATIAKKDAGLKSAERRISGNKTYINKCHARIREQDAQLKAMGKKCEFTENLQRAVEDREIKIAENVAYIKKCEDRIKAQDEMILGLKSGTLWWPVFYAVKRLFKRVI